MPSYLDFEVKNMVVIRAASPYTSSIPLIILLFVLESIFRYSHVAYLMHRDYNH
jgi:hypothetical protein